MMSGASDPAMRSMDEWEASPESVTVSMTSSSVMLCCFSFLFFFLVLAELFWRKMSETILSLNSLVHWESQFWE